jgi:ubiquinone/menaquinone biosynthesis C-methylase UbiE
MDTTDPKRRVKDHWEREVCGSRYSTPRTQDRKRFFEEIERARYEQDYMLRDFARFEEAKGKRVLEIGLGAGSDFLQWVRGGAIAYGRDLTVASIDTVKERLALAGLSADVAQGDAEMLSEFPDDFFDLYYSWGVLHHTPNPERAFAEAYRVLKPRGILRIMLYHFPSVGALLVWLRYGPLRFRFTGPREIYAQYVESPGTQMFSVSQAKSVLGRFFRPDFITCRTYLGSGDLLTQKLSSRYPGRHWQIVQALYPRWFVRHVVGHRFGTVLTIQAVK